MRYLLLCLLISVAAACTNPAIAQPDSLWTQTVIGNGNTILYTAAVLSHGGYAVAGVSDNPTTNTDFFISRIDEAGNVLWANNYAESVASEEFQGIVEVDQSLIAVGYGQVGDVPNGRYKIVMMGIGLNGDSLWYRSYEDQGQAKARDVILLADGNLGIIGYRLGTDGASSDVWLLKCTPGGDTLWTKNFGGNQTDVGQQIRETPDGDLLLLSNTRSFGEGQYDFWLVRTDAEGNEIESETYGTAAEEIGYSVTLDYDGNTYLAGRQGLSSGYVVKILADGPTWSRLYGEHAAVEQIRGLLPRFLSTICVGYAGPATNQTRPFMLGIDPDGSVIWTWPIGDPGNGNAFYGVVPTVAGGGLAFGSYRSGNDLHGYVMRIAPPGGVEGIVYDRDSGEPVPGVLVSATGQNHYAVSDFAGYYVLEMIPGTYDLLTSGYCFDSDTVFAVEVPEQDLGYADITVGVPQLVEPPSSLNLLAQNHLPTGGTYTVVNSGSGAIWFSFEAFGLAPLGNWLSVTPASGTIPPGEGIEISVTISADTTDDGIHDYYGELIIHTNSCPDTAHTIPVLVMVMDAEQQPAEARSFALHPAFPNPFNSETQLFFDLPVQSRVRLELFDITGRRVRGLTDADYPAGTHEVRISVPDLAAGMYLVRLRAGSFSAVQKLVFIK